MGSLASSVANIFTGADETKAAGERAAEQQRQASREGAAAAAFRPVGMTTRFGTSQFTRQVDPATGIPYISSAGYTAAPELQAIQERLFGQFLPSLRYAEQAGTALEPLAPATQRLFELGQQYLAPSPEETARQYISSRQALLQPLREQSLAGLRSRAFATGRGGLGVQTGTGGAPANPEMQAYYNALARQDLELAAEAEQAGQQRVAFGTGLLGTGANLLGTQYGTYAQAFQPLLSTLGASGQVEQLGMQPYQLGLQLGTAAQPGATTAANLYTSGQTQAAQTQYGATAAANAANAGFWAGIISGSAQAYGGSKSDIRTKENIKLEGKLPSGLNIYSFEYKKQFKDDTNAGHGRFVGVMAQEALQVIPEAVSVDTDGYYVVNYSLIH
jgi:hypothetical protein